jgi:hypothetical protein
MGKKKLIIIMVGIICLTIMITAYAQDFRQANWGMSKNEVKAIENAELDYESDDILGYNVKIGVNNFFCGYYFLEDKLYQAGYSYIDNHTNNNDYIVEYEKLKELLIQKYGKPEIDEVIWKNDLFKDDIQHWGVAISMGHLMYHTTWENDVTIIGMILHGDNYETSLAIGYDSKQLKEWANNIRDKQSLQNF